MDKLVSRDTGNEASRETESGASRGTEIGLLAKAFCEEPRAIRRRHPLPRPSVESLAQSGDCVPCRGLPWRASREAEIASGRRDLLREARGEAEGLVGSVVAGEGPMAYLLALFFRWDFSDPFDVCLGYPVLRYPTLALSAHGPKQDSTRPTSPRSSIGCVKPISKPMVRSTQSVQLYCINASTVSKETEMRFHMTHIT